MPAPSDPALTVRGPTPRSGGALAWSRFRARNLLLPVFLKVLWLHCACSQSRQLACLGQRWHTPRVPLPEPWGHWLAHRVDRFVSHLPGFRRRPCYWRSLMVFDLLPRFGFPARLHLGVARVSPGPDEPPPHLWVSTRDCVLVDTTQSLAPYLELAAYSSKDAP